MKRYNRYRKIFILVFCLISLLGLSYTCVTEFEPDVEDYEDVLVVEGKVTDQEGPYTVVLTKTYAYDELFPDYVTTAEVYILTGHDDTVRLSINDDLEYETPEGFQGEVGESYQLVIEADDEVYESEDEELLPVNGIDSIYWERDTKLTDGEDEVGIQIYADTEDGGAISRYYKWTFSETWEYYVDFYVAQWDDYSVCWRNNIRDEVVVANSLGLESDLIKRQKMFFLDGYGKRLSRRYCVEVLQASISKEVYEFYYQLNEQGVTGSLLETASQSIKGNMSCISNPDLKVLGIFEVSAIKSKYLFIDNADIPDDMELESGYDGCKYEYLEGVAISDYYLFLSDGWASAHFVIIDDYSVSALIVNNRGCFDCTANGDPNTPPDFWIDE